MTQGTFPYKGLGSFTYSNGRTTREVNAHYLAMSADAPELGYGIGFQSAQGITFIPSRKWTIRTASRKGLGLRRHRHRSRLRSCELEGEPPASLS